MKIESKSHWQWMVVVCCWGIPVAGQCDDESKTTQFQENLVLVDGASVSMPEAIRRSVDDPRVAKYRALRADDDGTSDYQRQLARWCVKHDFVEEANLHWRLLLEMEPEDSEAVKSLKLRRYHGEYLTDEEINAAKQHEKKRLAGERRWVPQLKKLKRDIEHGDDQEREAALQELSQVRDSFAISAMSKVFDVPSLAASPALVKALERMPEKEATALLARLGVQSPDGNVIEMVASVLQSRPMNDYVPLLVGALATPIELQVDANAVPGEAECQSYTAYSYTGRLSPGMYNKKRLSGNYTSADVAYWGPEVTRSSGVVVTGFRPQRVEFSYILTQENAANETSRRVTGRLHEFQSIEAIRTEIERENQARAALNEKIGRVLSRATRADLYEGRFRPSVEHEEVDPRLWWNWWKQKLAENRYLAAGTEVLTSAGGLPIEKVMVGDRVLSQDSTGRLSFQLVVDVTHQPADMVRRIEVNGCTIVSTTDQTFAVADAGWVNAGELRVGQQLASLSSPQSIESVSDDEAVAKHSLAIENADNYFIESVGIKVQSGTSR